MNENLNEKIENFQNEVFSFDTYGSRMLEEFYSYWSEPNKKGKMKFELEKTWDTKRRLQRWFNNQNKWNGTNKTGTSADRIETARKW